MVMAPRLNEAKALQDLTSLLHLIDDKGELQELLENESQLNDLIADNEEVCCSCVRMICISCLGIGILQLFF